MRAALKAVVEAREGSVARNHSAPIRRMGEDKIFRWATSDASTCVAPLSKEFPTVCHSMRMTGQLSIRACADHCKQHPGCTHVTGVARKGVLWCRLRNGVAQLTPERCARRSALRQIPMLPIVIVMRDQPFTWSPMDAFERAERTECSDATITRQALRRGETGSALPGSLEEAFLLACGPFLRRNLTRDVTERFDALHKSLQLTQKRFGPFGNVGRSRVQSRCYYELTRWLATARLVRASSGAWRVCETGFNAGHSAIILLSAAHAASAPRPGSAGRSSAWRPAYLGFDVGVKEWTARAARYINATLFPGQVRLVMGDSASTASPTLAAIGGGGAKYACEVLSIDGNHTTAGIVADWLAFRPHLHPGALVFFDDIDERHAVWNATGLRRMGCAGWAALAGLRWLGCAGWGQ